MRSLDNVVAQAIDLDKWGQTITKMSVRTLAHGQTGLGAEVPRSQRLQSTAEEAAREMAYHNCPPVTRATEPGKANVASY